MASRESLLMKAAERASYYLGTPRGDYWRSVVAFLSDAGTKKRGLMTERQQLWLDRIERDLAKNSQ